MSGGQNVTVSERDGGRARRAGGPSSEMRGPSDASWTRREAAAPMHASRRMMLFRGVSVLRWPFEIHGT
jgi:hypothetical protein